ncbi:NAD(P)-binding protein [Meredithblackwellia eburnea MCA 4105]
MAADLLRNDAFAGKVVILTGVGQLFQTEEWGNGAQTARMFLKKGAKVFGGDINLDSAVYVKDRLTKEGLPTENLTIMKADVTKMADVEAFVKACVDKHGRIDILVNNVGKGNRGDPASMDEATWLFNMDLNINSVYRLCHCVLPIMEKQGSGSIVNTSSIAGLRYIGKPQTAYNTSKAAVIHFTSTLAVVYAPKGIRINCVVPGLMNTPVVRNSAKQNMGGDYEKYCKVRDAMVPLGFQGDASDVSACVLFLASDMARYVTGASLVCDGGMTVSTGAGHG